MTSSTIGQAYQGILTDEAIATNRNRLLQGLPDEETAILDSILEEVPITSKAVFAEAGSVINEIHFPQTGVISLVTVLKDGGVEAITVGNDGVTGAAVINGIRTTFFLMVGQIPGMSRRAPIADFMEALPRLPELRRRLNLYIQFSMDVASQSSACNRMHVTEERCARWLLMSQDRCGRDEFELTQGFLSQMLGVRRPGVTVAIGILERAGLIAHQRGLIAIRDRAGLEAASCECYSFVKRRESELFG